MRQRIAAIAWLAIAVIGCASRPDPALVARSEWSPLRVAAARGFRFAGTQQFILRDKVEVQQFLFVNASATADVERLIWVQYERYLPGVEGRYEYEQSDVRTLGGVAFAANVRQYLTPPDAGSDRDHAYALLKSRGLTFSAPATRVRLVHVPASDPRSEVMIIYAERAPAAELTASERAAAIAQATAAVAVTTRLRPSSFAR